MSQAWFTLRDGSQGIRRVSMRLPSMGTFSVVVGRAPNKACDFVVQDSVISRQHAKVTVGVDGHVQVQDLHSTGGTFCGTERTQLAPGTRHALNTGDVVYFGSLQLSWLRFDKVKDSAATSTAPTRLPLADVSQLVCTSDNASTAGRDAVGDSCNTDCVGTSSFAGADTTPSSPSASGGNNSSSYSNTTATGSSASSSCCSGSIVATGPGAATLTTLLLSVGGGDTKAFSSTVSNISRNSNATTANRSASSIDDPGSAAAQTPAPEAATLTVLPPSFGGEDASATNNSTGPTSIINGATNASSSSSTTTTIASDSSGDTCCTSTNADSKTDTTTHSCQNTICCFGVTAATVEATAPCAAMYTRGHPSAGREDASATNSTSTSTSTNTSSSSSSSSKTATSTAAATTSSETEATTTVLVGSTAVFYESAEIRRICSAVKAYTESAAPNGRALREALQLFRGKPMTLDWDLRR
jgi:hypothetical protein